MSLLERAIRDLAIANRILAHHGVLDEHGHISARHPADPGRFLVARDCCAATVEPGDIVELTLDGEPTASENRPLCAERFVHGAIYEARPDIHAVLCAGSDDVVPFGVAGKPLRPVIGPVGDMGPTVPVWDIAERFGDSTDLAISTLERGRDLARCLGAHRVVLTRGAGFVATGRTLNDAVRLSVYIPKNARALAASLAFGNVRSLSEGESQARLAIDPESNAMRRGWEYWAREAGCERWL
ncbi:MAG: class II aldolase/adducin family protein [Xanthobacteraceae bacterium]